MCKKMYRSCVVIARKWGAFGGGSRWGKQSKKGFWALKPFGLGVLFGPAEKEKKRDIKGPFGVLLGLKAQWVT